MKADKIRILYVENEPQTREELSKFIENFCDKLYLASNGKEAFEIYQKEHPDIVISNISMPVMNGIELVKKIQTINPKQIIIFLALKEKSEILLEAVALQVDGYICKPVNFSVLEEKLSKLIQIHENIQTAKKLAESEERFKKIADNSQIGIFIYKEKFIYVNSALCELTGYSEEEFYAMRPWEILVPDIQDSFKEIAKRRLEGETFQKEYNDIKIITKTKSEKTFRITASTLYLTDGYAGVGSLIDITDLIKTQEELLIYRKVIEQMDEMVRITTTDGTILFVNRAFVKQTRYHKEELIGKKNSIVKSGQHDKKFYKNLWNTILSGGIYRDTFINKKKNGERFYEDQTITPIYDRKNRDIKYFVSTGKDITKRIRMEQELQLLATVDSLTGIYNRYKINQSINKEIIRTRRYNEAFALIMFDIDHFKDINDNYGHDIFKVINIKHNEAFALIMRESDTFGRWGGEEFMLLTPKATQESALVIAEKLRTRIEDYHFTDVEHITVSIGVALFTKVSKKEMILKAVDNALYKSKKSGRNKVSFIEN